MEKLTTEEDWNNLNRKSSKLENHEFDNIFDKFLTKTKGVAFEVGCVPGNILARICKKYGYFPEGIDFDKNTSKIFSETMEKHRIKEYLVYSEDFLKFKSNNKYDLVCSFGFIEHFNNAKEMVKKHVDLLKEGGKLIIEIPNFGGFNGFLHRLVDKPNLYKHNTSIMNLDFFREIVNENNLKVLYLDYYGSWHFQWGYGRRQTANIFQKGIYALLKLISKITRHINMRNNLSNYIFLIAEK